MFKLYAWSNIWRYKQKFFLLVCDNFRWVLHRHNHAQPTFNIF